MYHPDRIFQRRQAAIDATGEDSIEEISIDVDIGENLWKKGAPETQTWVLGFGSAIDKWVFKEGFSSFFAKILA